MNERVGEWERERESEMGEGEITCRSHTLVPQFFHLKSRITMLKEGIPVGVTPHPEDPGNPREAPLLNSMNSLCKDRTDR